jgi:SPX domain protein involved in polyphosphate accumulation
VFLERKTHHESWTDEDSLKERFAMKWKHTQKFLAGSWSPEHRFHKLVESGTMKSGEQAKAIVLAGESRQQILEEQLQPCVRTTYSRTAFQVRLH